MAPRIAIYAGTGASHSWLWFVDLCSSLANFQVLIINEHDIQHDSLSCADTLVITGGDTFAVAQALGPTGAAKIKDFVCRGGVYIGACAGTYLPLRSSKPHLNNFNFLNIKITNICKELPEIQQRPKSYVCYGCDYIFHPVREEVVLDIAEPNPVPGPHPKRLKSPLYGGPAMVVPDDARILATYSAFNLRTTYMVDPELASRTLLGHAAAVRSDFGAGVFYLFGPHFEHPHYPEANAFLDACLKHEYCARCNNSAPGFWPWRHDLALTLSGKHFKNFFQDIKREVSNSRIIAIGLENSSIYWRIGQKLYEPQKLRVFLENIWQKMLILDKFKTIMIFKNQDNSLPDAAQELTLKMRSLKKNMDAGLDSNEIFSDTFHSLQYLARGMLQAYFLTMHALHGQRTSDTYPEHEKEQMACNSKVVQNCHSQ